MDDAGNLRWYRHDGYQDGSDRWAGGSGSIVGVRWDFPMIFASTNGILYGITQ